MIKKLMFSLFISVFSFTLLLAETYHAAFYSDFKPISFSISRNPDSPEFHLPQGYEADLLSAIELIPQANMHFTYTGIKKWDGIWTAPNTSSKIDFVFGGITKEIERMENEKKEKVLSVTNKTVSFKQSLLILAKHVNRIKSHKDLDCHDVVGAVIGTTGEYRFLAQAKYVNNLRDGFLAKQTKVETENGIVLSDGKLSIYDPSLKNRKRLLPPPECELPEVRYFVAEDTMIPALEKEEIVAIARGYIGNQLVAEHSNGKFVVTALFSLKCESEESQCKEEAVFYLKKDNQALKNKLNQFIDYLTDNGKIDYDQWKANPKIFKERALVYPSQSYQYKRD